MAKRILIVDDEPDVLKMEVFRIKKLGHEIITATNGQEALDMIRDKRPDLVLLDVRLPIMIGTEVCRRVKEDEALKAIPVILVTASTETLAGKMAECKADDYILKPFDPDELIQKVTKFLGT